MNIIKVAVVGGRDYDDYNTLKVILDDVLTKALKRNFEMQIVSGGARGADSLGELYADNNNLNKLIFKPDWDTYGKAAGFIRNKDIISNADIVLAFWDGKSKGTKSSIDLAKKHNKNINIINYNI